MRQGQGSKRPRGRSNNGRRNTSPRHNNFDSNGPSVRIRGSATQVYEKYIQLARDATTAGDRVMAENLFQHAEHYLRILNVDREEAQAQQAQQVQREQASREQSSRDGNSDGARENNPRENNARQQSSNNRRPAREARPPQEPSPRVAQEASPQDEVDPKDQLPQFLVRDDGREKPAPRRRASGGRRPRVAAGSGAQPPVETPTVAEADVVEVKPVEAVTVETPETVQPDIDASVDDATRAAGD